MQICYYSGSLLLILLLNYQIKIAWLTFLLVFIKVASFSCKALGNEQIAEFQHRVGKELPPAYSNLTHIED